MIIDQFEPTEPIVAICNYKNDMVVVATAKRVFIYKDGKVAEQLKFATLDDDNTPNNQLEIKWEKTAEERKENG